MSLCFPPLRRNCSLCFSFVCFYCEFPFVFVQPFVLGLRVWGLGFYIENCPLSFPFVSFLVLFSLFFFLLYLCLFLPPLTFFFLSFFLFLCFLCFLCFPLFVLPSARFRQGGCGGSAAPPTKKLYRENAYAKLLAGHTCCPRLNRARVMAVWGKPSKNHEKRWENQGKTGKIKEK